MMYIDNEVLEKMIMTIVEGFDRIEKKLDRMGRVKEFLNGDELLDNYDIARLLNVSLRTVARYREKGLIRYYQTDENGNLFINTGYRIDVSYNEETDILTFSPNGDYVRKEERP